LRELPGLNVEVVNGQKGEFTVLVDGQEVVHKQGELPPIEDVVDAVKGVALDKQAV
jgi:hypothetical protein